MDEATKQAALSALRSLLIAIGSGLVAKGYLDDATMNQVVGAAMVLAPIAWGIFDKYRAEAKAKAREVTAMNVGIAIADSTVGPTPPVTPAEVVDAIKQHSSQSPS